MKAQFKLRDSDSKGESQARIVLRNSGQINPEIISHYIAKSGYHALSKALTEMKPQQIKQTNRTQLKVITLISLYILQENQVVQNQQPVHQELPIRHR